MFSFPIVVLVQYVWEISEAKYVRIDKTFVRLWFEVCNRLRACKESTI